jgi:hypothetical protein
VCLSVAVVLTAALPGPRSRAAEGRQALRLTAGQKDVLWLEPVLVTLRLEGTQVPGLPAAPAPGKLSFEVTPPVKPRPGAKPLPLEAQAADGIQVRRYDLSEWFIFPDKGGTWTVRAILTHQGSRLTSGPITVAIRKPEKGEAERAPMERLHHTPWSNYDTNAFCGDTFDLVQRWPGSRFARYCHYCNGRYQQNKKEYAKAVASYRTVLDKYPDFVLADDAAYGIVECLVAQGKLSEARQANGALLQKLRDRATQAGPGRTAVQALAQAMSERLDRELGRR